MKIASIILLALLPLFVFPQGKRQKLNEERCCGSLAGNIIDKETKSRILFAYALIAKGNKWFGETTSDDNGKYLIKPILAGKYDVYFTSKGYISVLVKNIKITKDSITYLNMDLIKGDTKSKIDKKLKKRK